MPELLVLHVQCVHKDNLNHANDIRMNMYVCVCIHLHVYELEPPTGKQQLNSMTILSFPESWTCLPTRQPNWPRQKVGESPGPEHCMVHGVLYVHCTCVLNLNSLFSGFIKQRLHKCLFVEGVGKI